MIGHIILKYFLLTLFTAYLTFRCQVTPKRMSFQSLKNLSEEIIVLISFVGLLTNNECHVKSFCSILVYSTAQGSFPPVILFRRKQ